MRSQSQSALQNGSVGLSWLALTDRREGARCPEDPVALGLGALLAEREGSDPNATELGWGEIGWPSQLCWEVLPPPAAQVGRALTEFCDSR